MHKRGFTYIELAIVILVIVMVLLLLLPTLRRVREQRMITLCQANLKTWGLIINMYGGENNAMMPPMHGFETYGAAANAAGCENVEDRFDLIPDLRLLFPDYISKPPVSTRGVEVESLLTCPARQADIGLVRDDGSGACGHVGDITNGDANYLYFDWTLYSESKQADEAMVEKYDLIAPGQLRLVLTLTRIRDAARTGDRRLLEGNILGKDLPDDLYDLLALEIDLSKELGTFSTRTTFYDIWRRRVSGGSIVGFSEEGMIFMYNEGRTSSSPIMWDRYEWDATGTFHSAHASQGVNVLYLDGHTRFVAYPGKPIPSSQAVMSPEFVALYQRLMDEIEAIEPSIGPTRTATP